MTEIEASLLEALRHYAGLSDSPLIAHAIAIDPTLSISYVARAAIAKAELRNAAEPDLLVSLKELLTPLERASAAMVSRGKALDEAGEAAFDRARAAIAKAEGAPA